MVKIIGTCIRVFPLLNETIVFSRKNPSTSVSRMTLCTKAFINMEDKCSLNLDKYHL